MYGTVARMKIKPGHEQKLIDLSNEWTDARGMATGQIAEYVYKLDCGSNIYLLVAVFADRDSYVRNAADPETDRWYRQLREHLEDDPEWNDGAIIQSRVVQPA